MEKIILFVDSSEFTTKRFLNGLRKKYKSKVVVVRLGREQIITKRFMVVLRRKFFKKIKLVLSDGCMEKRHIDYLTSMPDHEEFDKHWFETWEEKNDV